MWIYDSKSNISLKTLKTWLSIRNSCIRENSKFTKSLTDSKTDHLTENLWAIRLTENLNCIKNSKIDHSNHNLKRISFYENYEKSLIPNHAFDRKFEISSFELEDRKSNWLLEMNSFLLKNYFGWIKHHVSDRKFGIHSFTSQFEMHSFVWKIDGFKKKKQNLVNWLKHSRIDHLAENLWTMHFTE